MNFENTTFFIIPVAIGDMAHVTDALLASGDWERDKTICRPNFLLSYVHALSADEERFRVLRYLKTDELPIHMFEKKVGYTQSPKIKEFYLCAFGTGVAFLECRVAYGDMPITEIMDFAYHFKKADAADRKKLLKEGEVSLLTAAKRILMCEETGALPFFAYHNDIQYNCICYHLIRLSREQAKEEDVDRLCFYLKRSYDSAYLYNKENAVGEYDMIYKPYYYMVWAGCQEGLVVIASETDTDKTNYFLNNYYFGSLLSDYHFMYLMLLNQRFASLKFIEELASASDERASLERISVSAADLSTRYAFHVISDEMVYQNIYSDMYRIFHIDELSVDVKECGERMHTLWNAAAERHEKRSSRLLFALSCLTAFSALVDATGYFDRILPDFPLATVIGTCSVCLVFALIFMRNLWEGKRTKKKKSKKD